MEIKVSIEEHVKLKMKLAIVFIFGSFCLDQVISKAVYYGDNGHNLVSSSGDSKTLETVCNFFFKTEKNNINNSIEILSPDSGKMQNSPSKRNFDHFFHY